MGEKSQVRSYDPSTSAVFLKTNERFGGLSNMAPGFPIEIEGTRLRTSEALYQSCRYPHLPEVQRLIIAEYSPMTAKMRAKKYLAETRPDWSGVRVTVMRWTLRVKLAQNWRSFGQLLLSTGERPIVEKKTRRSDFWGAKPDESGALVGMNVLGRLLMELREQMKSDDNAALQSVEPLPISDFTLCGRPIPRIDANVAMPSISSPARPDTEHRAEQLRFFTN